MDPTCMSWAASSNASWSDPVVVSPAQGVTIDTNAAAIINANGSVFGLWRDHNGIKLPKGQVSPESETHARNIYCRCPPVDLVRVCVLLQESRPHTFRASDWRDPSTYVWDTTDLFSTADVPGALEDPTIWIRPHDHNDNDGDGSSGDSSGGSYHALFHMQYDCRNCGLHAFSVDGRNWTSTGIAYTAEVNYTGGTSEIFDACERPHIVMDRTGRVPIALTNGVIPKGAPGGDKAFTLLRPIATRPSSAD